MRSTSRHLFAISSLLGVLAIMSHPSPVAAKGDSAMILHTALVKPIKDTDRYSESMGAGADIRWIPRREWMTMSFGGFASIGRSTPSLTARDFYDFHFNLGVKGVSKREAGIMEEIGKAQGAGQGRAQIVGDGVGVRLKVCNQAVTLGKLRFEFAPQFLKCQLRLHAGQNLIEVERLGDIVDAACCKGLDIVLRIVQCADEQNGDSIGPRIVPEPAAHFVPTHLRHADIQQDEIWRDGLGGGDSLCAAQRRARTGRGRT